MAKFIRGRRSDFKSEEAFLHDVFEKNREAITQAFGANAEFKFINNVQAKKRLNETTIIGALHKLERSEAFMPYQERAYENVRSALKKYGKWKEFQGLTRDYKGRYTAWDPNLMKWDKERGVYIYNGRVMIDITNSPEDVIVTQLY